MTLDKLIEELNPYNKANAEFDNPDYLEEIWRDGFKVAFALFLSKERYRHQQDIDNISRDIEGLGYQGVDLSRLDEFIEV